MSRTSATILTPCRVRLAMIAIALGAALLVSACQPYKGDSGPKVFYTGDSLTTMSAPHIEGAFLGRGYRVAGSHFPGTKIAWSAEQVRSQVEGDLPDIVIIASGTNNWPAGWGAQEDRDTVNALNWAAKARCSVWILPAIEQHQNVKGIVVTKPLPAAVKMNARITALAQARRTQVANWGAHAAGHSEWYVADGVHHNAIGQQAYANFITEQTTKVCGAR